MLIGTYSQKLDEKGRLNFPVRFRDEMGGQFYVTCWLDECLIALPAARFEQIFARLTESGMVKNRGLRRMLYAGAVEAVPDKQGRILLPAELRAYAGLEKDVTIIGNRNHAEIWATEVWNARRAAVTNDQRAERLRKLHL